MIFVFDTGMHANGFRITFKGFVDAENFAFNRLAFVLSLMVGDIGDREMDFLPHFYLENIFFIHQQITMDLAVVDDFKQRGVWFGITTGVCIDMSDISRNWGFEDYRGSNLTPVQLVDVN